MQVKNFKVFWKQCMDVAQGEGVWSKGCRFREVVQRLKAFMEVV